MTVEQTIQENPYNREMHGCMEDYYQFISNLTGGRVSSGSVGAMYRTMRRARKWVTTRQMTGREGEIIHELKVAVPQDEIQDLTGFEPVAMTTNPHGGQWVRYTKKDFDPLTEIRSVLTGLKFPAYKPIKQTKSARALKITLSDMHVGMGVSEDSLFAYRYGQDEFQKSISMVINRAIDQYKINGKFDVLILQDLGDGLDGYNNQTTRGGHPLEQNMTNAEMFRAYIHEKLRLIDALYKAGVANEIWVYNSVNCNHAGDFGYMANYAIKLVCEKSYPSVKYEILERFVDHFFYGEHCFIQTHGKDKRYMKSGMPLKLDARTEKFINEYIDRYGIASKYIHFEKGDLHQVSYDRRKKFDYRNFMSLAPPSNWVQHNCGDAYWGYTMQIIDPNGREIINIDYVIDYENVSV